MGMCRQALAAVFSGCVATVDVKDDLSLHASAMECIGSAADVVPFAAPPDLGRELPGGEQLDEDRQLWVIDAGSSRYRCREPAVGNVPGWIDNTSTGGSTPCHTYDASTTSASPSRTSTR
jgi:hypothetical protein